MKSIAELKAEKRIAEEAGAGEVKRESVQDHYLKICGMIEIIESLSQKIAEDVGKCENKVDKTDYDWMKCKNAPEDKKCEGCKRALEIKRRLE